MQKTSLQLYFGFLLVALVGKCMPHKEHCYPAYKFDGNSGYGLIGTMLGHIGFQESR
ncbi:hypothetical protein A2U01_0048981, partial [Trifolium medium]|nr:hypothetical protein [Trifolium medium]